ncbi:MAG TPA: hypothetical protein VLV28_02525 [Gaiellaceae bacterium]|nr:hypothetical protein [Gaiellaceae bacterium]
MDEAVVEETGSAALTVLERLERIRELDRSRAPAEAVLDELRQLVVEAEQWARAEGDARACAAAAELGAEVVRLEEVRPGRVEVHQL